VKDGWHRDGTFTIRDVTRAYVECIGLYSITWAAEVYSEAGKACSRLGFALRRSARAWCEEKLRKE